MGSRKEWHDVNEIVQSALDLPLDKRSEFVAEACRDNPELQAAVEELLAISTREANALDDARLGISPEPPPQQAGAILGAFRIEHELGRGGMGVVYRALDTRTDRVVALKVLSVRARFDQEEGRMLARVSHPHIAALFESGETSDGLRYLAMEYVEGRSLEEHCAAANPSLAERLRLFLDLCDAVQHAHERLVVHGDLKPSNVLIPATGGLKLVDFGIARRVDDEKAHSGPSPLTRAFASPEQRRGEILLPTTDVYALGVLLHGLLTGRFPRPVDEALTTDAVGGPAPASLLAVDQPDMLTGPRMSPPKLTGALRGDLDAIVGKALRTDAAERYQTVKGLGDDVRRHLGNLPVSARDPTVGYRLTKFVRRRAGRLAIGAAALVVLLVVAGMLVGENRRAVRGEARALAEVERTRHVNRFVVDMLRPTNPYDPVGDPSASVKDVLAQSARAVENGLGNYPDLKASLLSVLGEILADRGDDDGARELLRKALRIQRQRPRDAELAETLKRLGSLLSSQDHHTESAAVLAEATAVLEEVGGGHPALGARILLARATNEIAAAHYEAARKLCDEALVALEGSPESFLEIGTALFGAGRALDEQNQDAAAEALFQRAVAYAQKLRYPNNPHVAIFLNSLGTLRYQKGDYPGARAMYLRSLAIEAATTGAGSTAYAVTLHNLAALAVEEGKYEEARQRFSEALEILQKHLPPNHQRILTTKGQLAAVFVRLREYDRAEALFLEVLAVSRETLPKGHPSIATTLNNLAFVYQDGDRLAEARAAYEEALEIFAGVFGRRSRPVASLLGNLGSVAAAQGDLQLAEARYREALDIAREKAGPETPDVLNSLINLGSFLLGQGRLAEGRPLVDEARALAPKLVGAEWQVGWVGCLEAKLLLAEGNAAAAAEKARASREILVARLPNGDWRIAVSSSILGASLGRLGRPAEAEPLLLASLAEIRKVKGERSVAARDASARVRSFYQGLGRNAEAQSY